MPTIAMKEEDDTIMIIDNVPVIIDLVALKRSEEVTLLVQDGKLFIDDKTVNESSCESGACAGCGSH